MVARYIDRIKHAGFTLARNIYKSDSAVGSRIGAVCVGSFSWGRLERFQSNNNGIGIVLWGKWR